MFLPESLGGYRLVSPLSEGGMGSVYLGRKEGARGFEKLVAIKVLLPQHISSDEVKDLFFSEARLAARLSHPNVCQVFDYGEEADLYYIVMEYIDGVSVQEIIEFAQESGDRLPPPLAARLVADTARGLHHAHHLRDEDGQRLHVVHRDVSPQNIIITWDGCPKVLDFGIAKSRARSTTTQHGIVRGKPAYMSPEQTRAEPLDARSDIFSLGTVLYELIVGDTLFVRENVFATIQSITNDPIADPRGIIPNLDEGYSAAAMCALSRNREGRFASADAMARALDQVIARSGVPATSAELSEYLEPRFSRRQITRDMVLTPSQGRLPNQATVDLRTPNRSYPEDAVTLGASSIDALVPGVPRRGRAALLGLAGAVAVLTIAGALYFSGSLNRLLPPSVDWVIAAQDLLVDAGPGRGDGSPSGAETVVLGAMAGADEDGGSAGSEDALSGGAKTTALAQAGSKKPKRDRRRRPGTKRPKTRRNGEISPVPEPTPAPAVNELGMLKVRARPWGQVLVDGRPVGNTPVKKKIPVGEHVVEVVAPDTGETRYRERVWIQDGIEKVITIP